MRGTVLNLDFADVKTILKDGGVAILSTSSAKENRMTKAIDDALHSPLLNNNDIFNAKKVMLNISFCHRRTIDGGNERDTRVHEQIPRRSGSDLGRCHRQLTGYKSKDHRIGNRIRCRRRPRNGQPACCTQPGRGRTPTATGRGKEKNKERIRKAYGESASNIGSKSLRKRRHIYLFNTEDLDNDDIIAMVEDSPTYMRDKTTLTKIRTKAALEEEVATEEATDDNGVITF